MSLNKVMLIGNVGQEPEIRYMDNGSCAANFSFATSTRGYTLQNGTTVPERTEWHNIVLWGNLAKIVESYVHKGDKLYVEGELRYRTYTDKRGATHKVVEIWGTNIELLTPRVQQQPANNATMQSNPFPPSSAEKAKDEPSQKCPF